MKVVLILTLFVLALVFVGCLDAYLAERRAVDTGTPSSPCRPATRPKEDSDEGARGDRSLNDHVGAGAGGVRPGAAGGGPGRRPAPRRRLNGPALPAMLAGPPAASQPVYRDAGPTIEQVRRLESLVVQRVDVADVSTTELQGYTGGVRAALVVRGDLVVSVDLSRARFEAKDPVKRSAVLSLPSPRVSRPRLDQDRTRLFELSRAGLWVIVPGDGGQSAAVNHAYRHAQEVVASAGEDPQLVERARLDAEETLTAFFQAVGWAVTIRWENA